jgi:hypothetical protein
MVDLLMQRGQHNIEDELIFSNYHSYIFHDSCGFEAGSEDELKIAQNFVGRRSQERRLEERLHVIWFVPSGVYICEFTTFAIQVLRSDGQ